MKMNTHHTKFMTIRLTENMKLELKNGKTETQDSYFWVSLIDLWKTINKIQYTVDERHAQHKKK